MRRIHPRRAAPRLLPLSLGLALLAATVGHARPLAAQGPPPQQPDARPTVAVMYFNNSALVRHADYEPLSRGVADMLISELQTNPNIRVVERDQLQKLLEEHQLDSSTRVDQATAVQVGKLLGARHMIFGGFVVDMKGRMRLDARAVDVETSQVEYVENVSGKADDMLDVVAKLATKLNKGVGVLPPMPEHPSSTTGSASKLGRFQALMLYSRGLVEQDSGNTERAAQLYTLALDKFPQYAPAQERLRKLRQGG